ncbi:hypothetical protein PoB_005830600 [Plakobranchus ocellatus]|uniref:G-protein coupled receptors family 1 profile domain-containing protein n=1 Tax=Plakobranchus ocellatus TaxID=259542 RepID=A0AAV4CJV2_9GAST|nr:hypothetical protein PoB_005830600 [Plakobranchus ocellatus]
MEDGNLNGPFTVKQTTLISPSQQSDMDFSSLIVCLLLGMGFMAITGNILVILLNSTQGFSKPIHVCYVVLAIFYIVDIVHIMWPLIIEMGL